MSLRRFWFTFRVAPEFSPLGLGCGVTARCREDAIQILSATVFAGRAVLMIESVVEDVDIRSLDQGHVVPNMGDVTQRGVWFPLGH
jgi:hypothetical protein